MTVELIRRSSLFASLSEEDLRWLTGQAEAVSIRAGTLLMEEGDPGDALYVVLEGEFEVTKRSGQQDVVLAVRGSGELLGELALLEQVPRSASVRALRDSHLLKISRDAFQRLLASSPSATLAIIHTVIARLHNTEAMLRQHEKMAMLGTLAAGLAHELNNPASAVGRSAAQLRGVLAEWGRLSHELGLLVLGQRQGEIIGVLRTDMVQRAASPPRLDPLSHSDRESALQTWLEGRGIAGAWELAPTLVTCGWDVGALQKLAQDFAAAQLPTVIQWLGVGCSLYGLLEEVRQGSERISEIVKAVKTYSYLDRAPVQEIDVHEGLENTLVILRHKIKQGVQVMRDYTRDLPRIEAYASQLNQVWTNIMDNALDAMQTHGELVLRTYAKDGYVVVEIRDTGPGIPPEIQPRIFEPFFTTKPPGQGTGLGLHIAYNIIVHKHHGDIRVTSTQGSTCFHVTLPIRLQRGEPSTTRK